MTDDTTDPTAKPWYTSMTILSIMATMALSAATKFGLIARLVSWGIVPADYTAEQLAAWLFVAIPSVVAIIGRFKASHVVTGTAAGAKVINDRSL